MAGITYAFSNTQGFRGLSSIYQFENKDGKNPDNVCGQAACATLLTYCVAASPSMSTLRMIEMSHPADIAGGKFGTSPGRIREILEHYGAPTLDTIGTEGNLKRSLNNLFPVICLVQNKGGVTGLFSGAHWFVAFAYNDDGIFVTNYRNVFLSWKAWEEMWGSPLSNAAWVVDFKGITCPARVLPSMTAPKNVA